MMKLAFGIPMPDDASIQALAVAWARFQQEYPGTKMTRKMSVVIDLATAAGVTYFPLVAGFVIQAKQKAEARKAPGFNIPAQQPQRPDPNHRNGADGARRTMTGEEIVLHSGAIPDKGKLNFGPN
jgi:hypothetical protein